MNFRKLTTRFVKEWHKETRAPVSSPVVWSEPGSQHTPTPCPVCGQLATTKILTMTNVDLSLPLVKCQCESVFYPNAKAPDYEVVEGREAFLMRVDQAEGVDSIIKSLLISPDIADFSVVDLGCGIGFAVDYSAFEGRSALGFDPSPSSKLANELLGIDISGLPTPAQIANFTHPNIVFASEVIEHVPDPRLFMRDIKQMTGDDGYAIIATPSAEYVKIGNSLPTLISILAPSQHLFLLSAPALESLARDQGFAWTHSWIVDERLFCVAGPRPITLASTFSEDKFSKYLRARLYESPWIDESLRWRCYGYRLFKQMIHQGAYQESIPLWQGLVDTYSALGLTLNDPKNLVQQYVDGAEIAHGQISAEKFPFNAVMALFLQGTFLLAYKHDKIAAKPFFDASVQLSQLYADFFKVLPFQMYDREIASAPQWVADIMRQHWQ